MISLPTELNARYATLNRTDHENESTRNILNFEQSANNMNENSSHVANIESNSWTDSLSEQGPLLRRDARGLNLVSDHFP